MSPNAERNSASGDQGEEPGAKDAEGEGEEARGHAASLHAGVEVEDS